MPLIQNTESSTETLAKDFKARDFFVNYRSSADFQFLSENPQMST